LLYYTHPAVSHISKNMATIINKTDGIEVTDDGGSVYFIKYANCKLIKSVSTLSIYDNSERRQGANRLRFTPSDVTNPSTVDVDTLYSTIRNYID
jgi:hypothetical protein